MTERAINNLSERYEKLVLPKQSGLPNNVVILAPMIFLLVVLSILVSFGITGTSSGIIAQRMQNSPDSQLIYGQPQSIRSDEWFVQTAWTISQVQQGLPLINQTFPGGMNATVQHDLPALDWSTAFRPNLVGFFFLPLDNAMSLKWWLPGFTLIAAAYFFCVTIMPRRPITSFLLAVGFFFSPFFQWWFISISFFAPAWALLVMATIVWLIRSKNKLPRILLPVLVCYLTVATGFTIYAPFIIPVAFVALAFGIGWVFRFVSLNLLKFKDAVLSLLPLIYAGFIAGGIVVLWLATRWPSILAFMNTVYPGQRFQKVGLSDLHELEAIASGPFSVGMGIVGGGTLGPNASEASTFLLAGIFLCAPLIWMTFSKGKQSGIPQINWLTFSLLSLGACILLYFVMPGWDNIAHLLLWDRTTYRGFRIGIGLLSFILIPVFIMTREEFQKNSEKKFPFSVKFITLLSIALVYGLILRNLLQQQSSIVIDHTVWIPIFILFTICIWAFLEDSYAFAAIALLIASIGVGGIVNPLYEGVYDMNKTELMSQIKEVQKAEPGRWVAMGDLSTVALVESGLQGYSGFQSSPSLEMWKQIDPQTQYKEKWNRLGLVSWEPREGKLDIFNPAPDHVRVSFDSCGQFAQKYVLHVLTQEPVSQPCLKVASEVISGPSTFWIYDVIQNTD